MRDLCKQGNGFLAVRRLLTLVHDWPQLAQARNSIGHRRATALLRSIQANTCFSFGRKLKDECTCFDLCFFVVLLEHFQRWNDAPCHRLLLSVNGSNRDLSEEIQLYPCFLKQHHAWTLQPTNADHSYQLITSGSDERKMSIKLVPRVLSFTNMAAGIEKTLGRGWMSLKVVSE